MPPFSSRSFIRRAVILGGALATLMGCAESAGSSRARRASAADEGEGAGGVGKPLPALVLASVEGSKRIDLAALKGKVVLLDIWASWCAPCREEMPMLDEMAARLAGKGIAFVAVSIDEEKAAAQEFLRARPRWSLTLAHDPKGKVPEIMQPPKMPTSYIIDAVGVVRYVNAGFERSDAKKIEDRLTALAADGS
jgi:thiol-disulfide isomerase/thioredoxin